MDAILFKRYRSLRLKLNFLYIKSYVTLYVRLKFHESKCSNTTSEYNKYRNMWYMYRSYCKV